jgi:FkbM family methyltransferase
MSFRTAVTSFLRRYGYAIGKYPAVDVSPIPVFHALVQLLTAACGKELNVIQVGANDGRGFGDPLTRYFDSLPWRGVLVEPQAEVCELLKRNYAAAPGFLAFENVAVSPCGKSMVMYRQRHALRAGAEAATYASSVVSANPTVTAKQLGLKPDELEPFEVPCVTLDSLIDKYEFDHVDILQIDTEGYEKAVLETLSLDKHQPRLIQFEHGHMKPRDITAVSRRLADHDYRILYGGWQMDSLACHESALTKMGIQ